MGVVTFTDSIISSVPAAKLFKALYVDNFSCFPKAAPHIVRSVEIIQGNGGPGTILQTNYAEGALVKYVKSKIDVLDKDNMSYIETVIEGGELSDKIESVTYEIKVESTPNDGSVNKTVVKYQLKAGAELTEEELKPVVEEVQAIYKAVEVYLLANPDV